MAGTINPAAAQRWSADRVHALAPDPASQRAGAKLAGPAPWSGHGAQGGTGLLWGDCKGSGAKPYQVTVELATGQGTPAYACSCPSRKFPCKHALGLMLLWSAGGVPEAEEPPQRVQDWLEARRERAERSEARKAAAAERAAAQGDDEADPTAARKAAEAAERRTAQRIQRIDAGLDDLELWLCDQVRSGLTGLRAAGYRPIDDLSRRLIDAQAGALAARVRELTHCLNASEDWPERTLAEFSLLHLLIQGWRNRDSLPAPLAATVRRRIGLTMTAAEIADVGEHASGRWLVLGSRDLAADKLVERRVWLQREADGRIAMLLAFAPAGQAFGIALPAGAVLEAELAFAPDAVPLRAVLVEHTVLNQDAVLVQDPMLNQDTALVQDAVPVVDGPQGATLDEAAAGFAAALAADPWTTAVPVVLDSAVPLVGAKPDAWQIVDAKGGGRVPLLADADGMDPTRSEQLCQTLLACTGGHPAPLFGLYRPAGLTPITIWNNGQAASLW
ncbi:MAG TPA: SWIM zinc finger family protein [Actinocrinis sp.]|nr:SWIM zinc finger family protein [Actinocrinis sp.]